jgi:hypothetical protein
MNAVRCLMPAPLSAIQNSCVASARLHLVTRLSRDTSCDDGDGRADVVPPLLIKDLGLHFTVSLDEEYVHLRVVCGTTELDLGSREHHHVLLTLARIRLEEEARGLSRSACGWTYSDHVARNANPQSLNLDVFRIRRQFRRCAVRDAAGIVERRTGVGQIRIGTGHVTIFTV